jgi:hypothetical protein
MAWDSLYLLVKVLASGKFDKLAEDKGVCPKRVSPSL